jgi:two-component system, NtrC family, sensor histidine kinase HydH
MNRRNSLFMKSFPNIQPRYIIAITVAVAVLMFGSAFIELQQSRNELLHMLQEHSFSLAETIERSSGNIVLSTEQIEHQLAERLLNNAFFIARLDSESRLSQQDLYTFCEANGIYRINIINNSGKRILGSHPPRPEHIPLIERNNPRETLLPILSGKTDRMIIGLKQARFEEGQRYAVAIRRTRPGGGAIVLNLDAQELVEFRKRIGIGKLLKDLGDNADIDYVVLQDREGVLAATNKVREISSIAHDSLLALAFEHDTIITRNVDFNGHGTYEVAQRLTIDGSPAGVLRIGLSMKELQSTESRMSRRMLVMTFVLIAIGALVFTAIVVNQNYRFVSKKYHDIQSFTGSILANMRDAVITLDNQNRITIFNHQAEELFGTPANTIIGKQINELSSSIGKCLSTIFIENLSEASLECSGGRTRIVSITLSYSTQSHGSLESRTAVIKDLTETRQMEREIQRKDKLTAMGELASGVAHEIRNPLNAISMIAQRYEKEFVPRSGSKEYRSLTQVLKKETARVNNIIQQFLAFARPPKIKLAQISAQQFVSHLTTLFEGQAKERQIEFSSRCSIEGNLRIDQGLMTQAILNLLQNALDATPPHGSVQLNVSKNEDTIVVEVRDTGVGIPKENLEIIFNLYFTTKTKGNGMGLAITQQIIAQHHGHIQVGNASPKGTAFIVSLPFSE